MKNFNLFILKTITLISIIVTIISCNKKESDYSNFFKHSINEDFSIEIPRYLEEQDFKISSSNQQYADSLLLARIVYQQQGINDKFEKGQNILPIPNTLDINLISGTSKVFNIENISELSFNDLEKRDKLLNKMVTLQAKSRNKNAIVSTSQELKINKTEEGTYYFTKSFKINETSLTIVIIPLEKNMINISYSSTEQSKNDFETSIKSLKLISNL